MAPGGRFAYLDGRGPAAGIGQAEGCVVMPEATAAGRPTARVAAWLARHGVTPQLVWVEGHNHISEIASLGVDDDALGTQLCRFIERVTEPALAPPSARWH